MLGQTHDWSVIGNVSGESWQTSMSKSRDSTVTSIIGGGWIYMIGILSGSDDDLAYLHKVISSDTIENANHVCIPF